MDLFYYVRYFLFRIALYVSRESRRFRFKDLYDFVSLDPVKFGGFPQELEIKEEWPLKNLSGKNDSIQVFCQNKSQQILFADICRKPDGYSIVNIYLKTKSSSFTLTKRQHVDLSNEDTFSAGGLRFESVNPMKRWRISFNGLLRFTLYISLHSNCPTFCF